MSAKEIVEHERDDESSVYPRLASFLADGHGLCAMSRAHREILHLARLLARLSDGLRPDESDRYLIRDAQRIIESIESLVRMHNAQEEDIYEQAVDWRSEAPSHEAEKPRAIGGSGSDTIQGALPKRRPRAAWGRRIGGRRPRRPGAVGGGWLYWSLHRVTATRLRHAEARTRLDRPHRDRERHRQSDGHRAGRRARVGRDPGALLRRQHESESGPALRENRPAAPIRSAVDREKANLAEAEARLEQDKADLAHAKTIYERNKAQAKRRAISRKTLDKSRKTYAQAQERTKLDEAAVAERQAARDAAEINLGHADIVSPADGTVVSRNVEIGQTVAADAGTPLFVIATDLTLMRVDADVGETDIGEVKLGDKATFTVEALPNRRFAGEVTRIGQSPRTSQKGVTYDVVIGAANPELLLKPGMTATARIVTDRRDAVLRVPDQALRYSPGNLAAPRGGSEEGSPRLWVLRDGKPTALPVELGLDDGAYTEIVKGDLQPGDDVIVGESARFGKDAGAASSSLVGSAKEVILALAQARAV